MDTLSQLKKNMRALLSTPDLAAHLEKVGFDKGLARVLAENKGLKSIRSHLPPEKEE